MVDGEAAKRLVARKRRGHEKGAGVGGGWGLAEAAAGTVGMRVDEQGQPTTCDASHSTFTGGANPLTAGRQDHFYQLLGTKR